MTGSLLSMPSDADLRRLLKFSTNDGLIWLGEQRMLLLHLASLQAIRKEMISSVGVRHARKLMMRAGFTAGTRDAQLARQVRPDGSLFEAFAVGLQLHMLEGAVRASLKRFEVNLAEGTAHIVVRWDDSWEAQGYDNSADEPVCWMLLGYASGYTSQFFQRITLFRETQCLACGHSYCEIEGRFLEEWPDGDLLFKDYEEDPILERLEQLHSQVQALQGNNQAQDEQGFLIGRSTAFQEAFALLQQAAPTNVSVLLTGETGVGKELFARSLHAMSPRADKPFIAINCAALPHELIESELFGVEKGAFTSAIATRLGRFERADGGTLMLDELGELPLSAQAKLLRVLQSGELERLGGHSTKTVDVRIIAATNVNLEQAVAEGRFRNDLLYRLNVYPIRIPSLRERIDDIEPLANHLLQRFNKKHGKQIAGLSDLAIAALRGYEWLGNIRELENLIERGVILTASGQSIEANTLFPDLKQKNHQFDKIDGSGQLYTQHSSATALITSVLDTMKQTGLSLETLENCLLHEAVEQANGSISAAARNIGLTRAQLSYRLTQRRSKTGEN